MRPSQLCLSPCPPTSAPQKQYPAFSTQMEVTPYASKPLSFCQGSRGLAEVTVEERQSFCLLLRLLFLLFPSTFFSLSTSTSDLKPPYTAFIFYVIFLPTSFVLTAPSCAVLSAAPHSGHHRCATVHLLKVLWQHHLLNIDALPQTSFLFFFILARSAARSCAQCLCVNINQHQIHFCSTRSF